MDVTTGNIEPVTLSDILELATWSRQRTSEELQNFVNTHHAALPDDLEIE
ncbi:MAG: hypothetical protein ABJA64_03045 [Candidatus Saccharibacteria bacterium]